MGVQTECAGLLLLTRGPSRSHIRKRRCKRNRRSDLSMREDMYAHAIFLIQLKLQDSHLSRAEHDQGGE